MVELAKQSEVRLSVQTKIIYIILIHLLSDYSISISFVIVDL